MGYTTRKEIPLNLANSLPWDDTISAVVKEVQRCSDALFDLLERSSFSVALQGTSPLRSETYVVENYGRLLWERMSLLWGMRVLPQGVMECAHLRYRERYSYFKGATALPVFHQRAMPNEYPGLHTMVSCVAYMRFLEPQGLGVQASGEKFYSLLGSAVEWERAWRRYQFFWLMGVYQMAGERLKTVLDSGTIRVPVWAEIDFET